MNELLFDIGFTIVVVAAIWAIYTAVTYEEEDL